MPQRNSRRTGEGVSPQAIHHPEGLAPELALAAAVLRQAVIDVRQNRPSARKVGGWLCLAEQLSAVEWLCDAQAVGFWAELLGLDTSWLQRELLTAAGLTAFLPWKRHS